MGRSGCFARQEHSHARRGGGPWAGYLGCFASEVEFSKGYRHFASVITLAKCGSAVKAEASLRKWDPSCRYRCENSPWRAAPGPGSPEVTRYSHENGPAPPPLSNETHWGRKPPIGVGNLPAPMPSCLPQYRKARRVACPNAPLPTPMREGTRSCLPQCGKARHVACPNALLPTPMRQSTPRCPPQYGKARSRPPGPPFHGGVDAHASFCS